MAALLLLALGAATTLQRRAVAHVHAHSCADSAYLALFLSRLVGIPYSLTLHSSVSAFGSGQTLKWTHAAFGICVSEAVRSELVNLVPEVSALPLEVVAMGVDSDRFRRGSPYRPPPLAGREALHLVSCGRLHRGKGHDALIEAVALLRDRGLAATLRILGGGPDAERLRALIGRLKLEAYVELTGAATEDRVRESLEAAHVFVLGSHSEAIGVATMEAMSMGLPVVVTDVGGVSELVRDGVDGYLVPARDPQALAYAVAQIASDEALALSMSVEGRSRVVAHFGACNSARALSRLALGRELSE